MSRSAWTCDLSAAWPVAGLLLLGLLVVGPPTGTARAASEDLPGGFSEEEVSFRSGDVTLSGTVLVPDGEGRHPAIALVHGAGPRERNRLEAEAFARRGIVTLIYDKRTEGYSQFERSYELLADDALAAVRTLRGRADVDRDAVGLWGLSEGGWVVPIAASRSDEVAFVVLVAATGVPPARQHAWYLENQLRRQGVSGSMVKAVSRTGVRLIVDADLFAEANHDPVEPLEQVRQPVLALWGEKDRVEPPAESARILRQALRRGGNTHYTIRFFADAEHGLHSSPDGFVIREHLAPGYPEAVTSWITAVARGEAPGPSIAGPVPQQARLSSPLAPLAWWESGWMQLGAMLLVVLAFASYLAVAFGVTLARLVLKRSYAVPEPATLLVRGPSRWLAITGLTAVLGFVAYFGFLMFTGARAVGFVAAGRPLPWLALEALAVATCAFTALLAAAWWSERGVLCASEKVRLGVLLFGGAVFVPWAAYWGLLVP